MEAGSEVLMNILGIAISWPAAICLILGIALVIIEMFTPGLTVPGIAGIILIIAAIILTAGSFLDGMLMLLGVIAILSIALFFVLRSASKGMLSRSPIIKKDTEEEYLSVDDMKFFIGKEGKALTILRPAGTADFNGVRLDVVTEGSFVKQGVKVKVIRVEGRRIIVAPIALDE